MSHDGTSVSRTSIPLRFRDLDTLGHLNQSVYHVILEEARVRVLHEAVGGGLGPFVLARVELDYRHEIRLADREVVVETVVEHVGRSSVRMASRMLTPSGVLAAEAVTVLVAWDADARRSRPLSDEHRAALLAVGTTAPAAPA